MRLNESYSQLARVRGKRQGKSLSVRAVQRIVVRVDLSKGKIDRVKARLRYHFKRAPHAVAQRRLARFDRKPHCAPALR